MFQGRNEKFSDYQKGEQKMQAIKTVYNDIPEQITIPKEFTHKKGEIIIIIDDTAMITGKSNLQEFYGSIPDFPERGIQGDFSERDLL